MKSLTFIYSALLFLSFSTQADIPSSIKLAATDWCPYTCEPTTEDNQEEPGIVVEYLRTILSPYNIALEINYLPWKRAIQEVDIGKHSGLITAVKSEAPNLLFTTTATMQYGVCLYSHSANNWKYDGISSLNDKILAVALDYSYNSELDEYINNYKDTAKITTVIGEDKISRFYSMIESHRVDVFVSDQYVASWNSKKYNIDQYNIKRNKCFEKSAFYLAINPELTWGNEFVNLLNDLLSRKENQELLTKIIKRYTQGS